MNLWCIYQRRPVRVQISNFQRWHKLGTGHDQKVEIEEELELLVENLRGERRQASAEVSEHVSKVSQDDDSCQQDKEDVDDTKRTGWVTVRVPERNKIHVNTVNFTLS